MTARVEKLFLYPIKSLDGVEVASATLSDGGSLLHDREFAIVGEDGNFVIGKSTPLVHRLRPHIDFETETLSIRTEDDPLWHTFHLDAERTALNWWLSDYFKFKVKLHRNLNGRFLDIPDISGITVLSTASLGSIADWFPPMQLEETRKRFRANLELGGVPAFWEDCLFAEEGTAIEFRVGETVLLGISPRARCVVPTRHPETGEPTPTLPKQFAKRRKENLPAGSQLEEYGHFYYLTVNCFIPETEFGKTVRVGDAVEVIGKRRLNVQL